MHSTSSLTAIAIIGLTLLAAPGAAPAQSTSGIDVDVGVAGYRYREPGLMRLSGAKGAARLGAAFTLAPALQLHTELRYTGGDVDYRADARAGGGGAGERRDYLVEGRALLGHPTQWGGQPLIPFAGLGYRYLFSDLRGLDSAGGSGIRRDNRLLYLPLGVMLALPLDGTSTLAARAEIDAVLTGRQRSRLGDADAALGEVTNKQHIGIGAKLALTYGRGAWRLTPYIDYWRIGASNGAPVLRNGAPLLDQGRQVELSEPRNHTVEAGLLLGYRF